ncbi:inverse autotransporter beta domain-containing protein [Zophobihabitans entericus]|uniref:Inverse autotransporter beta-domain domain-containing protein n=1 Tax=Zophobihabitans entericus TaxID=1635327 RepID=A0A6G9IEM3_9GAMM|nr:inverse autotransporter beta domain-containing protein [Zophobihabitans entericus]QIQ22277.1 hypothetical protein IPMB12_11620 [Zophobihabitans entericus]
MAVEPSSEPTNLLSETQIASSSVSLANAASHDDNRINFSLNYQFNQSWQDVLDPKQVAVMRSLQGSRYDLVQSNNNIVLEYQK